MTRPRRIITRSSTAKRSKLFLIMCHFSAVPSGCSAAHSRPHETLYNPKVLGAHLAVYCMHRGVVCVSDSKCSLTRTFLNSSSESSVEATRRNKPASTSSIPVPAVHECELIVHSDSARPPLCRMEGQKDVLKVPKSGGSELTPAADDAMTSGSDLS